MIRVAIMCVSYWCVAAVIAEDLSSIVVDSKQKITSYDSRHPEVARTGNGDLVVAFSGSEGQGHDRSNQHIMCVISSDGGQTWSDAIDVFPTDGSNPALIKDPYLLVAPNGDIICSYVNPSQENIGAYSISSDNGRTWTYKGRISPDGEPLVRRFVGGDVVGDTMYACGEAFDWQAMESGRMEDCRLSATLWRSNDSGQSWECVWVADREKFNVNEWDLLAIDQSHFIAAARPFPNSGETMYFESMDAGRSWSLPIDISDKVQVVEDPNLSWLDREAGTILLHGRLRHGEKQWAGRSGFWISSDKGKTWGDCRYVTDRDTRDEYTGFAEFSGKRSGYLVWGEDAELFGAKVEAIAKSNE